MQWRLCGREIVVFGKLLAVDQDSLSSNHRVFNRRISPGLVSEVQSAYQPMLAGPVGSRESQAIESGDDEA